MERSGSALRYCRRLRLRPPPHPPPLRKQGAGRPARGPPPAPGFGSRSRRYRRRRWRTRIFDIAITVERIGPTEPQAFFHTNLFEFSDLAAAAAYRGYRKLNPWGLKIHEQCRVANMRL